MIITLRCCPTQSWVNPTERIMSILNLALQNCSLERKEMGENFEITMKGVNSMNHLRNLSKRKVGLRESFQESMKPVREIVNSRFECMALKDSKVVTFESSSFENVDELFKSIHIIDGTIDMEKLTAIDLKNYHALNQFMELHCHSTHYAFQIQTNLTSFKH